MVVLDKDDFINIPDNNYQFVVTVTDSAGNSGIITQSVRVDTTPPTVTVDPIFGDYILNRFEAFEEQIIRGSSQGAEPGSNVAVSFNGQTFTAVVGKHGEWYLKLSKTTLSMISPGETI